MRGFLYGGLSALLLTTASAVVPVTVAPAQAQMIFNFSAPIITNSGLVGDYHFIRVAVTGMALEDLMISLPDEMERFAEVQVIDGAGKAIPADIKVSKERVSIDFASPVKPEGSLEVRFTRVQMRKPGGQYLLYGVTAQRVGLRGEIPVGTAQVFVPGRDG
jgi:hypothetical protein